MYICIYKHTHTHTHTHTQNWPILPFKSPADQLLHLCQSFKVLHVLAAENRPLIFVFRPCYLLDRIQN